MKYIERISISSDHLLNDFHLDTCIINISINDNIDHIIARTAVHVIALALEKKLNHKVDIVNDKEYLAIRIKEFSDNAKATESLLSVATMILSSSLEMKEDGSKAVNFFNENKDSFYEFVSEIKEIIAAKEVKYFFQNIDGFN